MATTTDKDMYNILCKNQFTLLHAKSDKVLDAIRGNGGPGLTGRIQQNEFNIGVLQGKWTKSEMRMNAIILLLAAQLLSIGWAFFKPVIMSKGAKTSQMQQSEKKEDFAVDSDTHKPIF